MQTTFSTKVSPAFAKAYRAFCDTHCLQIGKFTEHALSEIMEDYHFGIQAQAVLANTSEKTLSHQQFQRKISGK